MKYSFIGVYPREVCFTTSIKCHFFYQKKDFWKPKVKRLLEVETGAGTLEKRKPMAFAPRLVEPALYRTSLVYLTHKRNGSGDSAPRNRTPIGRLLSRYFKKSIGSRGAVNQHRKLQQCYVWCCVNARIIKTFCRWFSRMKYTDFSRRNPDNPKGH